jgi:CBS domain-containing protein
MTEADRALIVQNCSNLGRPHRHYPRHRHHDDTGAAIAHAVAGNTVVITGAMIPWAFGSSDGLFNLGSALSFAQVLPAGVYVAMNGKCFPWDRVRKNRSAASLRKFRFPRPNESTRPSPHFPRMQTIVIGHKNPDMDSICSAIAYAHLKEATGTPNVIAARAGHTNERIDFVLQKFGVEPPVFISDLSDRVSDVMERDVISVRADSTVYDAIHLMEKKRLRGLPVVDREKRLLGLLSAFKISRHLSPPREEASASRRITAPLSSIVETFGGKLITGALPDESAEYLLIIGR